MVRDWQLRSWIGTLCGLIVLAGGTGLLAAPPDSMQRFEQTQPHMGTRVTVVLYAADAAQAERALAAAFARFEDLDDKLSDYDIGSELSRLSLSSPHEEGVTVSDPLWRVLVAAKQWSQTTEGAFDPTIGPLTRLWRRARRRKEMPDAERLQAARTAVGYQAIELDPAQRTVRLTRPGMRLDLGGIAKGFAADEALQAIQAEGVTRALIDAGGDLVLGDPPAGQPGWRIGVARLDPQQPPSIFLSLSNCGVASSGDAWQFVEIDGVRYSHIVDPRTGLGLTERSSVTVIAPSGTAADAFASGYSVMGPRAGLELARKLCGVEAWSIHLEDAERVTRHTDGFLQWQLDVPENQKAPQSPQPQTQPQTPPPRAPNE